MNNNNEQIKEFWEAFLVLDVDKVRQCIEKDSSVVNKPNPVKQVFDKRTSKYGYRPDEQPLDKLPCADSSPTGFPESVYEKRARSRDGKKFDYIKSGVFDNQKEASRQIIRMLLENGATSSTERSLEESFDERFPNTRYNFRNTKGIYVRECFNIGAYGYNALQYNVMEDILKNHVAIPETEPFKPLTDDFIAYAHVFEKIWHFAEATSELPQYFNDHNTAYDYQFNETRAKEGRFYSTTEESAKRMAKSLAKMPGGWKEKEQALEKYEINDFSNVYSTLEEISRFLVMSYLSKEIGFGLAEKSNGTYELMDKIKKGLIPKVSDVLFSGRALDEIMEISEEWQKNPEVQKFNELSIPPERKGKRTADGVVILELIGESSEEDLSYKSFASYIGWDQKEYSLEGYVENVFNIAAQIGQEAAEKRLSSREEKDGLLATNTSLIDNVDDFMEQSGLLERLIKVVDRENPALAEVIKLKDQIRKFQTFRDPREEIESGFSDTLSLQ